MSREASLRLEKHGENVPFAHVPSGIGFAVNEEGIHCMGNNVIGFTGQDGFPGSPRNLHR